MLFGVICTYVLAYGAWTLLGGVVEIFRPKLISDLVEYVTTKTEEFNVQDMQYRNGEGALDSSKRVVLAEFYPPLVDFEIEELRKIAHQPFWLTEKELTELRLLLEPIVTFEQWAQPLPKSVKDIQRSRSILPVLAFLARIPEIRREKINADS